MDRSGNHRTASGLQGVTRWLRQVRYYMIFRRHVRPSDIFLVGHPKSGNTWLAYMLAIVRFKDREQKITLANLRQHIPFIHHRDLRIREHAHMADPRIIRNESPLCPALYPRTVYLIRDPRAVVVSLYHMYRIESDDRTMTLPAFLDDYLGSRGCFRTWNRDLVRWDHQILAWIKRAEDTRRVMIVNYEDMVENRGTVLRNVLAFAGIPYAEEDLALAVARSSFEAMRQAEEQQGVEAYSGDLANRGRFIRRGQIDAWQQELDDSLVHRIEQELAEAMKATGYRCRE